ncbi:MAG: D-hexose-6-phosphate mutarotase, partial [Methylococcaceae bacterium]|nr:D-hexose-6-phosphate mutarotase [Methylococcaceae bacterium]
IFTEGKGGLPFIKVNNKKASALISIYAGQILSYKPVGEKEDFLFTSENAFFQNGKAIKGGIPICWPWFGAAQESIENSKLPNHGFVRDHYWSVVLAEKIKNGDTKIKLEFVDTEETRKMWPYQFHLSLEIYIGESLTLELLTKNTGNEAFIMTEALHTYFNVGDAAQVEVLGLEKTEYLDKSQDFIKVCQIGAIKLSKETDRIHVDVEHDLTIKDPVFNRKINIVSLGNKNVVVWNPWEKGSKEIIDLEKEDYKRFVCVEIANAAADIVELSPGEEFRLITDYRLCED